jgi:hypothetical protein
MSDDEWHDPRMEEAVEVVEDNVYGDTRFENNDGTFDQHWRAVHVDDEVVLLRSNINHKRAEGHRNKRHRLEQRDVFEKELNAGRYKKISESEAKPPKSDNIHYHFGIVKRMIAHYSEKPGRTAQHKAEALNEVLGLLEEFDAEEIDWTDVPTIGQAAAENLREAGFYTTEDVRLADDEELLTVSYVGENGVDNIREFVDT